MMRKMQITDRLLLAIVLIAVVITLNIEISYHYKAKNEQPNELYTDWQRCHNQFQLISDGNLLTHEEIFTSWKEATINGAGNVLAKKRNMKDYLTIGIPVYCDEGGGIYLKQTLQSLFNTTSLSDKKSMVVMVFLLPDSNEKTTSACHTELVEALLENFLDYIHLGFIQLIQVPKNHMQQQHTIVNLTSTTDRRRSRTLQGLLWALTYKGVDSDYYLHLTVDMQCGPDFMSAIRMYITAQDYYNWWVLDFCEMPEDETFACRLMRSADRHKLAEFLGTFSDTPEDHYGNGTQSVRQKNASEVFRERLHQFGALMAQSGRFVRKPFLFIPDVWSSAKVKQSSGHIRKIIGDKPEVSIYTNMLPATETEHNNPEHAYYSESDYYTFKLPINDGHHFELIFKSANLLQRIDITTGVPISDEERDGRRIEHAILETSGRLLKTISNVEARCADWRKVGTFVDGHVNVQRQAGMSTLQRPVQCIRIRITALQDGHASLNSAVIFNIAVVIQK